MAKPSRPRDDESSAPESGTVRGPTSGNNPSDRNNQPDTPGGRRTEKDDPSIAGEER